MIFTTATISTRNQFGELLRQRGLVGTAVEVGTHRGEFARILLKNWPGVLYCVDPWENLPGYKKQSANLEGGGKNRSRDHDIAKETLQPFAGRVHFLRMTSEQALPNFPDGSLDFVYLDGDHSAEGFRFDLCNWWQKVKPGGILAGHDVLMPGEINGGWAQYIQPVLFDFCREMRLVPVLVAEENGQPWSFFIQAEAVRGNSGS